MPQPKHPIDQILEQIFGAAGFAGAPRQPKTPEQIASVQIAEVQRAQETKTHAAFESVFGNVADGMAVPAPGESIDSNRILRADVDSLMMVNIALIKDVTQLRKRVRELERSHSTSAANA